MIFRIRQANVGEILVAWQKYKANGPEELDLCEGDLVELLDTEDPAKSPSKRIKLDPDLDNLADKSSLLSNAAARHKLSVKPLRRHASSRYSPTRNTLDTRWLVKQINGSKKQGWVPCNVLQSTDEPKPGTGLPGDAAFRRQAVVKELVETEHEFVKDLDYVVQEYLIRTESTKVPKVIKDNLELVFGGLVEIANFHRTVLMEGVKYYANEPNLLGKAFLRLERDFDKHVKYCTDEPIAQTFLESCDIARDYFDDLSQHLGDDKNLSEHLKLPIQRINDYQLLLKELVRYSECLGENCANLQNALELMLSIPHRAEDDKFTSSIEGYRGSIYKLGRLISHDWFSVTFGNIAKERYLFLFKARILITKVRRISDDRSIFQLKDIIRLPQIEIKDHPNDKTFELVDKIGGHSLILASRRDHVKELWLKEIREFASDVDDQIEELQIVSEATSTLTSDPVPTEFKSSILPQATEAQKLLAAALKSGIQEKKVETVETPRAQEKPIEEVVPVKKQKLSKDQNFNNVPSSTPDELKQEVQVTQSTESDKNLSKATQEKTQNTNKTKTKVTEHKVIESTASDLSISQLSEDTEKAKSVKEVQISTTQCESHKSIESQNTTEKESTETLALESIQSQNQKILSKIQVVESIIALTENASNQVIEDQKSEESITLSEHKVYDSSLLSETLKNSSDTDLEEVKAKKTVKKKLQFEELTKEVVDSSSSETLISCESAPSENISLQQKLPLTQHPSSSEGFGQRNPDEPPIPVPIPPPPPVKPHHNKIEVSVVETHIGPVDLGVQISVEVDDKKMSRRYSGKGGEDYDSSFSRRSIKRSSYTASDGLSSSRHESSLSGKYGSESISAKYGSETLGSSKYGTESLMTSKYSTESSISNKYGTESVASKYGDYSSKYAEGGETGSLGYTRKSLLSDTEGLTGSKHLLRRSITEAGNEDGSNYTRKYHSESIDSGDVLGSYNRKYGSDLGDGDSFSYSRKSVSAVESGTLGDGSRYSNRKTASSESSDGGTSKYARKSYSSYKSADDSEEDVLGKYSRKDKEIGYERQDSTKRSISINEDADVLSKFSKYERRISETKKVVCEDDEEEAKIEAEMRKKYAPNASVETKIDETKELLQTEAKSFGRSESKEYKRSESSEVKTSEKKIKSQISTEEEGLIKVKNIKSHETSETTKINSNEERRDSGSETKVGADGAVSTTFKIRRESSVIEGKPNFKRRLSGTNVEPGESAVFEVELSIPTDSVTWLKDNRPLRHLKRIKTTKSEDGVCRLEIKEAEAQDVGLYSAVATNSIGNSTCSAQLIVHELTEQERAERLVSDKPIFLVQLKDTELLEDTYLRFMVKVKGDPTPTISFFKDDVQIKEKDERYHIVREASGKGFYELVIPQVQHSDSGTYKCLATNKFGEASSEATITVTDFKNIFGDLSEDDPLLPPGEKPAFYWKKDGNIFEPEERFKVLLGDDEDSLALVFQHVRPEDAGLYTCVAQTSSGHISCSAELTVHGVLNQLLREPEKPQLVVEHKEACASVGNSAMLELQVKGYPKPQVKWTHDGKPIEPGGKYKFLYEEDEESMSLVIKNVEPVDAGSYLVSAENELGNDTAEMTLTVKAPPKIKTKFEDVSVAAGVTIRIPVEVEGMPKPTLKFYKDGQEVKLSERIKVVEEGDKHILIIEKSNVKDAGSYSVVASNEISQSSGFWNIDVFSPPKITKTMGSSKIVSLKEEVILSVTVEAKPEAEITWYKNDVEISSDKHYILKKDEDSYFLKITGTVSTDSASYKVRAKNIHGSVDDECQINVKVPPKLIKGLSDMTVVENQKNVELDVKVEAFPKPTVKWYFDEMEISESRKEFTRIESDDGSKLVIKEVTSDLSGKYKCKLVNELGETETSAKLTVNCKPRFVKHLKDTTIDEGATLHLEVEVEACPEPSVKWLRNGREVTTDARIKISRDSHRYETYHLAVDLIKYEEQGEYEVVVTNSLGTVSSRSIVTVQKVTHTDAIEETEPPKKQKFKIEVVDNEDEVVIEELKLKEPDVAQENESDEALPKILDSNLNDKSQYESLDVCYVVKATANPKPTAVWTRDEKPLKADSHVSISESGDEYKLEIKNLKKSDAGVYQCKVVNPVGDAKTQAKLTIIPEAELRRPKVKEELIDKTILKSNAAKLSTVIVGEPVPEVAWLVDGKEMVPEQFEKYKIVLDADDHDIENNIKECTFSLTIPKSEQENSGKYKIKAKNKWGECESSAQLTIVFRPEIEGPNEISVVPGESGEFSATVIAHPAAKVTWCKDGKPLESKKNVKIEEHVKNNLYKVIFENIEPADEGKYQIIAKNEIGETTADTRLKTIKEIGPTPEKPYFITALSNAEVEDGEEIILMVRADGIPKPEISWYFNGTPLYENDNHTVVTKSEAQITSTLTIPKYSLEDIGQYKAVAKNIVGETETVAKILMVQKSPTFGKMLDRSQDINEGEPLKLVAKVSGSPKPTISWLKNGEPLVGDHIQTTISPDGTVKLYIDKVKPSDSGAYKLVIKNPNGESSSLCAVAVTPRPQRPKFIKCMKDVQVTEGQPIRLEAQVSGYPLPEIKWQKDGVLIRPSSSVHLEQHPDGNVALVVDCVKPENAGTYTLIATNKLGEGEIEAQVTIDKRPTKPEFITRLQPLSVVEGFPAKFEVKVKSFPPPKITWTRNGVEVVPDNQHIKITDLPDGTSTLLIDACDIQRDPMSYKAVASNEAGETESSAILSVTPATKEGVPEEAPMFLTSIRDAVADEGQPLVIEIPFTANPIPKVEWFKDDLPIEPSEKVLLTCDGKKVGLHIDNCSPADAGKYSVKLTNALGSDIADGKAIIHKVFSPPRFTQRFTDTQQLLDHDAKLAGKVSGVPTPEITWFKDGSAISPSNKYKMKTDGDLCSLYIFNCQPSDIGLYRAFAVNKEGSDTCEAQLSVVDEITTPLKAEAPTFLKRIGDMDLYRGMTAKFTACASGYPEPTVEWFRNDKKLKPSDRIKMEMDQAGLLRLTIAKISEDDLGKYSCKITNEHGSDICYAKLQFDDIDAKPRKPIADEYTEFDKHQKSGIPVPLSDPPIISRMTDRHCTLSWKPSVPSYARAPVTYQLEMCELPQGDWFTARSGIRNCDCTVGNLEPFRDYRFRIRIENKYGISDPSPYATTFRQKLEPDPPKFNTHLPLGIPFHPDSSPYFPHDFDIERPPHDNMAQSPRFLRQEHPTQYGMKDQNSNLFWYVYGYPKPKMEYLFNDEPIESGGRFDTSYTRNGQATLFINKMLERDVGWYEAIATNEHGIARQRVRLEIAEFPEFIRRPEIQYSMIRGKARFEARITGKPYPEIKWYKDWKPVVESSRVKIKFIEPDLCIFTIDDIILKDLGLYSVSARNVAGSISSSAMLYVDESDSEYKLHTYSPVSVIKSKKKLFEDFFDIGDELGRGTQGITYHAVDRSNGYNYAAKIMHGRGEFRPFMFNELDVLNQLRHRRLISLHEAYESEDRLVLLLELGGGGELIKDYLLRRDYYTESEIAGYIRQILQGFQYMHDRGYGHMGLNIGDILLTHPGSNEIKITDFSLSRRITSGNLYPLWYGVPEYVCPEAVKGEGTGYGQDMWSIGIITFILLSGRSPFLGKDDRETLNRIIDGNWSFDMDWWCNISVEARDFISKLLVYDASGRLDINAALRHPWLERADTTYRDEYQISTKYLNSYYLLFREWYDNASCRRWFRRRRLETAFTHPSRMVYPPGESYTPPPSPLPQRKHILPIPRTWEEQLPSRSPLNYEIGIFKSESHYQNGPDTYLLQLRDVSFPVRVREYMKVAANRGPGRSLVVSNENGFDWETPVVRERRRFTDVMDEEIDDERKARINKYGSENQASYSIRRLRRELGPRLDTYAEAEAMIESKQDGRLPFFREKPQVTAMVEGRDVDLTCFVVGDPKPTIQWFKNDAIVVESARLSITTDSEGRTHFKLSPALGFDVGMYRVVARNKVGQTVAWTRIVYGQVPDSPDSPEANQVSDSEILLTWKAPKHDGNSPVLCYSLQYKLIDSFEWIKKVDNIDHEFYLMSNLEQNKKYLFRLAACNAIGWSEQGVPSAAILTLKTGAPKIELSTAMRHLQQITDSGKSVEPEVKLRPDYALESKPVEWINEDGTQQYEYISEIHKGHYSNVLKAIDKKSDKLVVAKLLDLTSERTDHVDGEFAALRSLRHERIAGLLEAFRTSDVATFIMEKLQGSNVLTYLASRHEYTEETVATIVSQVLDGLQYLHWRNLCHLDIQPDNVVMCGLRSVQVKLVDFGCAHRVTKLGTKVPIVGHPDYISPEVLNEELAYPQTDIWSLGVLAYVMLSGVLPFQGQDTNETRQNISFVRYRFEYLYQELSQEGNRFIMMIFKRHPNKRPTAEECHENRWLLPTDSMIKKRERAVFLGSRLKEYCEKYQKEKIKPEGFRTVKSNLAKSLSIQEELLISP